MTGAAPLSLAEIRFYVTRAVAGAGAPFGVGEDVAEAVIRIASTAQMDWRALALALDALGEQQSAAELRTDRMPVSALIAGPVMVWNDPADPADPANGNIDDPVLAGQIAEALRATEDATPPPGGVAPDAAAWAVVQRWFRECLVPSSARSRLSGAGAGLVETD